MATEHPYDARAARSSAKEPSVLTPVDPVKLLERLRLTTGKAAEFCGVSRRQLCYWTDTGIVSSLEDGEAEDDGDDAASRRLYDFEALYRVMLIKQVMSRARGLRRAAKEVVQYLDGHRREAAELEQSIDQKREAFLSQQADRIDRIVSRVRELAPTLRDQARLLSLLRGLDSLTRFSESVSRGKAVLEEDPRECLHLASLVDQMEARLDHLEEERGDR